jgi:hypothetical protein
MLTSRIFLLTKFLIMRIQHLEIFFYVAIVLKTVVYGKIQSIARGKLFINCDRIQLNERKTMKADHKESG